MQRQDQKRNLYVLKKMVFSVSDQMLKLYLDLDNCISDNWVENVESIQAKMNAMKRALMPLFVPSCQTKILELICEESFFERFFTS